MDTETIIEDTQLLPHQNTEAPAENDQMVIVEDSHLDTIETDDLANIETDELVSMEDDHDHDHHQLVTMEDDHHHHHHHLVTMDENHQLVSVVEDNQLDPFENHQLTPIENSQMEYNPMAAIEHGQLDDVATPLLNRRRKKKSMVWQYFDIGVTSPECRRAFCKKCNQSFAYSTGPKVAGTSHLKRHIAKGSCKADHLDKTQTDNEVSNDIKSNENGTCMVAAPLGKTQTSNMINNDTNGIDNGNKTPCSAPSKATNGTNPPKRRYKTTAAIPFLGFDPDRSRQEISRMIIMHDYPLHIVEHPGFVSFIKSLQPRFDMVSFDTVQGDIISTYMKEKQALQKVIEKIPGRICLTLDMWGSNLTTGYAFLTGSYIDADWKLHRKLLNVVMEAYPESDSGFSHAVASCLSDWNIEGKLFTLTLNQGLSEGSIDNLRALLSIKNPSMLNGQLLLGNCLARSLSSVAREALNAAADVVKKVRDSVKYVRTNEFHEEKFIELKQQLQVPSTKTLAIDDYTRWNTTYEMLVAASELKEVFSCLDTSDQDYKNAPSMEVWKKVETLCAYLKQLFETASILSAKSTPTTNAYFHEVWKIQLELVRAVQSEDPFVCSIGKAMKERFDEYWKSCSLVLAIAVIMDPRFKMRLVDFSFSKIYGEDSSAYVKMVDEGIHELYLEYLSRPLPILDGCLKSGGEGQGGGGLLKDDLALTDFDMYIMQTTSQQSKTELDQYLEESLLPRVHEFDVLGWWNINKIKYPTLSKMARDILTIPVCTVGPSLVFDMERREMDNYRCSLRPETVEALICAKDWLKSAPVVENTLGKIEFPI